MPKPCTFCDIQTPSSNAHVVFEDENFLAFLDVKPLFVGHTLVIPKQHIETLYELPEALIGPYFQTIKSIGIAVQKGVQAAGSFIAMNNTISQSVPHLHVHIVPRNKKDGLIGFFWPRRNYRDEEEKDATVQAIKAHL